MSAPDPSSGHAPLGVNERRLTPPVINPDSGVTGLLREEAGVSGDSWQSVFATRIMLAICACSFPCVTPDIALVITGVAVTSEAGDCVKTAS